MFLEELAKEWNLFPQENSEILFYKMAWILTKFWVKIS